MSLAILPAAEQYFEGMRQGLDTVAWAKGLSRIELTVRTDNANAKALYGRFGFVVEGINRRAFLVDSEFFDTCTMALVR